MLHSGSGKNYLQIIIDILNRNSYSWKVSKKKAKAMYSVKFQSNGTRIAKVNYSGWNEMTQGIERMNDLYKHLPNLAHSITEF